MQPHVRTRILQLTQADAIARTELIQPLWNNYGTLSRVVLQGGHHPSVIVKHIQIPDQLGHPRGFASAISRDRKIRSYRVETHWYGHQNQRTPAGSPTPKCLDAFADGGELFLLLEDLSTRGFDQALHDTSWSEITVVLAWLAHFHAQFLGDAAQGLWPCGTYWHLATRPEELANIEGTELHRFASLLDARLRCGGFPTLVHGDAKLANFLFSEDLTQVAAVDFQYVGLGSAMKDVIYFVGSCLSGPECERRESELLSVYFSALRDCLPDDVDAAALETEWRALYPVAWADFQRFMSGWSPGHRKLTDYSDATTERAIDQISGELLGAAREACLAAGRFIQANKDRPLEVGSKGFESRASDVVTEIDIQAQAIILDRLKQTIERYDLGVLAEEGEQDDSRLRKHAFWTIDPLDGTQHFIEGRPGYSTSIALVSQSGQPILGAVYDPVDDTLYEAVTGRGVTLNGEPIPAFVGPSNDAKPTTWFADRSLPTYPHYPLIKAHFDIRFVGGAVMNGLQLLTEPNSVYVKATKKAQSGCAIWDLAAVVLMVEECSGSVRTYGGGPLHLNRPESVFFNDVGFAFASADVDVDALLVRLHAIGSSAHGGSSAST
jgi:fructose-1,6-bisphosphatase/inositol monophosphatase family enzyme